MRTRIRFPWPRSVLGLVLLGFLLVTAPLIAGLLVTGQQIERLTRQGETALAGAVNVTREARASSDQLQTVERTARQFRVLRDEEARDLYLAQRRVFLEHSRDLLSLDLPPALAIEMADVLAREAVLADRVLDVSSPEPWPRTLSDAFAQLTDRAGLLLTQSELAADQAVVRLQQRGERARRMVWVQLVAVIPLAMLLGLVFTRLITRPVRQIDQCIRQLTGATNDPILPVAGPRDLRVLSVRLEWARRRLQRIDKERQRLLGQVSHELKTPLASIGEGVSLLQEELFGTLNERQTEVVGILHDNARRLEQQIESLLRFNNLRAALYVRNPESVSVDELVHNVVSAHALTLTARDICLEMSDPCDLMVYGDSDMLHTALDNLVSNAIKFSERGGRIGISVARIDDCVTIQVCDDGPGISVADRYRVFEPFYRGQASAEGAVPGSGLGLSICRDLIRAHGGSIELIRGDGWQTVFQVRLPRIDLAEEQT